MEVRKEKRMGMGYGGCIFIYLCNDTARLISSQFGCLWLNAAFYALIALGCCTSSSATRLS
jgi:hypothetical protein